MADYYPLLAKAVAGLPGSTAEARSAIYERARKALFGQLRSLDPPVPEEAIEREAQALEVAVARLETELASRSPASRASLAEAALDGVGPAAGTSPAAKLSAAPPELGPPPDPLGPAPSAPVPAARSPRPSPLLKVRRDLRAPGVNPGAPPNAAPPSGPAFNPVLPAPSPARNPAPAAWPASKPSSAQGEPQALEACGPQAPALDAPAVEASAPEAPSPSPGSSEPAARPRLDAQRLFAPRSARDAGAAKRLVAVGGIVGLLVALVAIAAYKLRDRPEDLVRPQPTPSSTQGEAGAGGKIVDRIGAGTATPGSPAALAGAPSSTADRTGAGNSGSGPAVPVARRAALLVEAPEEQSKVKAIHGTVVWRVDNVSNGPDEPLGMAVRAEIDIPEEELQAAMTIQQNSDGTLPASHTLKLLFAVPPASPLANIKQISVLLRREDAPLGEALKGITVPITENSFLIGLARGDAETSNLDLLRSREWFDVPMVLANGHIAKLTFEKGLSGQRALDDAMASWQTQ